MMNEPVEINGIKIDITDYRGLSSLISNAISTGENIKIGYANANTINLSYRNHRLKEYLGSFDFIHPDGAGIKAAINFLYPGAYKITRFTGSDFYPVFINNSIKNNYKLFFFGHTDDVLSKIPLTHKELKICGMQEGYDYDNNKLIADINASKPDILIIGLGTPLQEKWVFENKSKINVKVIICTGEGIRVFAGIKQRGPVLLRKLGLEWLYRFNTSPLKYFNRYIIGNPLFLYRIIILKMRKLRA